MSARRTRVYHRLQLAAQLVKRAADREVERAAGLTTNQAAVLSVLVETDGATQKEVARRLGHTESAMTPMARRLERLGFLERRPSDADRRAWCLYVTKPGRAAHAAIAPGFARVNRTIDRRLAGDEVEALADALDRLIDAFGERPPGMP